MGFPGLGGGQDWSAATLPSQQPSHSSPIIPEESKQCPWCTGASGTGPPLAPYRAGWTRFPLAGEQVDISFMLIISTY